MTNRRKSLVAVGAVFGVLLASLLILPVIFRGRIATLARAELDRMVAARIDWGGIGLTFFRDFPNLTLGLRDLRVVGVDRFEGDTLATAGSLRVVLDVGSVVRNLMGSAPIVVRSIRLAEPDLSLAVLEDGTANWDIMRPRAEPAGEKGSGRALNVELRSFEVSDGHIVLENAQTGLYASLEGLHHTLSGNFSQDSLGVRTRTHADRTTVRFAGTSWLAGVRLDFDANVDADLAHERFAFRDNELRLNDLALRFSGTAARDEAGTALDVTFAAPGTEFAQILSLVPAVYARDFTSLETSGTFTLDGRVRGTLAPGVVPGFAIHVAVDDGMFRYPDLPLPARAIALDLAVDNPGGDADSTVLNLRRFHAEIGGRPLDATLTLRTPVSDPDLDARVKGTLDLADVARTVKLEGVRELTGMVAADASLSARRSDVENARYDRIGANGSLSARNVSLAAEDLRQPVAVEEATLRLSPRRTDIESFQATIGSSDLRASGWIDNVPGFVMRDEPLRGSATFESSRFVLDEWKSDDPALQVIPVPAMLDLELNGTVGRLTYGALEMSDARGKVHVKDERLTLEDFRVSTLGGRIGVSGYYETIDPTRPTFALRMAIDSLGISNASEAMLTVRTLAPVARFARGTFSANFALSGALARDLTPLFDVLDGTGSLLTSRIALVGFPMMQRLAEALKMPRLDNPTFNAIRSNVEIRDGRLHVRPFQVGMGDFSMLVSGSNGIDQSLDYSLELAVPRAILGNAADRLVQDLSVQAGRAGIDLQASDSIRLGIRVTGTITDPSINVGLAEAAASMQQQVGQAAGAAVQQQVDKAREQVDSARAEAVRRAQAQADSIVADAEVRADTIRAEARRLGDNVRAEGNKRADEVLARATNAIARRAAQPVADRIRKEADDQANTIVHQADERADALVAEAHKQADDLVKKASGEP
jgi:AsmA-like C-terminal region